MQVSRSLEYAVRSLVFIAESQKPVGLSEISQTGRMPRAYLAKIMRTLVEGGVVSSVKGRKGGYVLKKVPKEIALYDILSLTEGDEKLIPCISDGKFCYASSFCSQKVVWIKVEKAITDAFKKVTLKDMLPRRGIGKVKNGRTQNYIS
jgi:Rrf2 family protein